MYDMKGIKSYEMVKIINFVRAYHKFGTYKTKEVYEASVNAGVEPELAKHGLSIKYVDFKYDSRANDIWKVNFNNRVVFTTNKFTRFNPPPNDWPYGSLYELCIDYLLGKIDEKHLEYFKE